MTKLLPKTYDGSRNLICPGPRKFSAGLWTKSKMLSWIGPTRNSAGGTTGWDGSLRSNSSGLMRNAPSNLAAVTWYDSKLGYAILLPVRSVLHPHGTYVKR